MPPGLVSTNHQASRSYPLLLPVTYVFGILGGIASGKSLAASTLAGPTGLVLSADAIAHEALGSPEVSKLVGEHFGAEALDPSGQPDREALARLVFADPDSGSRRKLLESWIHPRVRARILARLGEARAAHIPRVVLDVPLLLENDAQHGFVRQCDALVFLDVDQVERERRAQENRGWSAGEVTRREGAQLPLDQKRTRADHIINNNGTPQDLINSLEALLSQLELT
jgi:dephospho-CoA kinase